MKNSLLAVAVTSALAPASNVVAEDQGPTLYGRVNLAIEVNDDDGLDNSQVDLRDVVSRVGIRGQEQISDDLSAIYHYEFRVNADRGSIRADAITQRLSYVGLKGAYGELTLGAQWSTFSDFIATNLDPTYTLGYFGYSTYAGGDYRIEDSIKYSGSFGPVSFGANVQIDGGNPADDSIDRWQVGASYSVDNLVFGIAYDTQENTTTDANDVTTATGNSTDVIGASISYAGDGFKFNVGYLNSENEDENIDRDFYTANITYSLRESLDLYGQYFMGDGRGNDDQDGFVLGAYYYLSARTILYFEGVQVSFDGANTNDINRYLFGLRHDF